jgi:hypothetical protein
MNQLKALAKHCDWAKKMPSSKATLAKKLHDTMEEETPKRFLAECDSGLLKDILEGLEVDLPSSRKEYKDTLIKTAETFGLENCFSSFPVTKLKEFVKACQLKVDSDSMEILLQALMEQVSIIAPYEVEGETPSKEKPELDKNIRIVDLWQHYYREDLANWLEDRKSPKLISHGNKKELIERVHRALNDKLLESDKKKERKRKSTEKEATTTTTSGEDSSKNKTPSRERKSSSNLKSEKKSKRKHESASTSEDEPKSSKSKKDKK